MHPDLYLDIMTGKEKQEAQAIVVENHYLHTPVDSRCSIEGYWLMNECGDARMGLMLFGRPQATRCADWYGSVDDVIAGRCEVTRWQVLNLARVFLHPQYQSGGDMCWRGPGFVDRKGVWRSKLASAMLRMAVERIGYDYLVLRPPVFLDEPYQIEWLLSYCDTKLHKGTIYKAAGFDLYKTNDDGIQTWRIRLPALTDGQREVIRNMSRIDPRAKAFRARRAQLTLI